jgi:hypothetical protein
MSKLTAAFGDSQSLRIKTFTLGDHEFKVRVPLSKEMEEIQDRITKLDDVKVKERYEKMAAPFKEKVIDGVMVSDEDVVVDGRSIMDMVKTVYSVENKILEYIKLLVPANGSLDDITYDEIEAEWPTQVQMEILEKISEAIQPGYKDARKN